VVSLQLEGDSVDSERRQGASDGGAAEAVMDSLLAEAHLLAAHDLPELAGRYAVELGADEALIFLADLQQTTLMPFRRAPGEGGNSDALLIDGTLAGRAFQHVEVHTQQDPSGRLRLWLPLLDGTERLGVVSVVLRPGAPADELEAGEGRAVLLWRRFATLLAELVMTKTLYSDTIVRLRRLAAMGLAAETQWSLLPPLTFTTRDVSVAGALEPAYEVAGDTFDYAVDPGVARAAIFDGMGHGLGSAQLAVMAVSAYRNARRAGRSIADTVTFIDDVLVEVFGGAAFTTALLTELDTATGLLRWVSAGHPLPLLLRDGRLVKQLGVEPRPPLGVRLANRPPFPIVVGSEQLEPGDRVVMFTDGVVEARSPHDEFFGEQRLVDLLTRNVAAGLPVAETLRRVVRSLLEHQQGQLDDDASVLHLEWRPANLGVFKDPPAGASPRDS
jgi:acyl dehydratase